MRIITLDETHRRLGCTGFALHHGSMDLGDVRLDEVLAPVFLDLFDDGKLSLFVMFLDRFGLLLDRPKGTCRTIPGSFSGFGSADCVEKMERQK